MRERELWLLAIALFGFSLGIWGVLRDRSGRSGRQLGVGAMFVLGAGAIYAAIHRADGLVPLGLAAGTLVVAMLWGEPRPLEATPSIEP